MNHPKSKVAEKILQNDGGERVMEMEGTKTRGDITQNEGPKLNTPQSTNPRKEQWTRDPRAKSSETCRKRHTVPRRVDPVEEKQSQKLKTKNDLPYNRHT
jgi:hypothetical protein